MRLRLRIVQRLSRRRRSVRRPMLVKVVEHRDGLPFDPGEATRPARFWR